jgi:hypothetical protein
MHDGRTTNGGHLIMMDVYALVVGWVGGDRWVDNITMNLTEIGSMWNRFIWLKVGGSDGHL